MGKLFRRICITGISTVVFFISVPSAHAASRYWVGSAGGNWNEAANWSVSANSSTGSPAEMSMPHQCRRSLAHVYGAPTTPFTSSL